MMGTGEVPFRFHVAPGRRGQRQDRPVNSGGDYPDEKFDNYSDGFCNSDDGCDNIFTSPPAASAASSCMQRRDIPAPPRPGRPR